MAKLYVLSGPDVGRSYEVSTGALIGRAADCAVHLRDASVSRQHARLELEAEAWVVLDLESRNGLRVGGERVRRAALEDGAEFQLGEVLLRFRSGEAAEAADGAGEARVATAARPAQLAPEADAGIELEGDWSDVPAPLAPAASRGTFPRADLAETSARPRERADLSGGPHGGSPDASPRTALRARAALAPGLAGRAPATAARGILQYQREPDRQGFFSSDLAQQPGWVRLLVVIAVIALALALFWLAFRGTAFLKGKAQGVPPPPELEAPR